MQQRTLFDDKLDDEFLRLIDAERPPRLGARLLEGHFNICSPGDPPQYYLYYFELYEHAILCRKDKGKEQMAYMEVLNAIMRRSNPVIIKGVRNFGIKFIKRRTYEELFSPSAEQIDRWFEALKPYCLMTKFRLYFDTIRVLGKGNFAKVFLVRKKENGRELAVKAFAKSAIMGDALEVRCLQYEIKIMRMVAHERVMRLYELYEGENFVYCVLELMRGADLLQALIKKGAQPELKALTIIQQILEGLAYLHSLNIIHRDLKPENILFKQASDAPDIAIVDLGFATLERDYRRLFTRCGTPGYVAPEVLADRDYDCKADVFSAGVIAYMILTGVAPFQGTSYREIVRKNLQASVALDAPSLGVRLAPETLALLRAMLEKDPTRRISSAAALRHEAFAQNLSRSPLIAKPGAGGDRLLRFKHLTDQNPLGQKKVGVVIPDRIEDLSPMPAPRPRN